MLVHSMPPQFENPPLDKLYVSSYDESNEVYPILFRHKDPNQGPYTIPAPYAAPPDLAPFVYTPLYPNHGFIGSTPYGDDQRVIWKYMLLPGPWIYTYHVDPQSLMLIFEKRRHANPNLIRIREEVITGTGAAVTLTVSGGSVNGGSIAGGSGYADFTALSIATSSGVNAQGYMIAAAGVPNAVVITEGGSGYGGAPAAAVLPTTLYEVRREDIDSYIAWEVITYTTTSPFYNSLATATIEEETISYAMPQRIDVANIQLTGLTDLYWIRPQGELIPAFIYRYWVISTTDPTIVFDQIIPDGAVSLNLACSVAASDPQTVGTFHNVLHDAFTETYGYNPCGSGNVLFTVTFPATTPSFTDYQMTWIGSFKVIKARASNASSVYIYMVEITKIKMF